MPTPCPCEGRADLPASRDRGDRRDTELHGRGPRGVLRGRQDPGRGYSQYRDHRSGRQGDLGRHTCAGYGSALAADRRDAGQAHPRILRRRSRAWCARTARSDSPATRFSASAAASCKAQQANVLYASSSTNSSSARNDSRNAIAPPRSDRTLGVVQGPFHRYASTYRPGATRTSRRRGTRGVGTQRGLDRGRRHWLAQRCFDGRMDVPGPHRLVPVGQDAHDGLQHPARPARALPAGCGLARRPAVAPDGGQLPCQAGQRPLEVLVRIGSKHFDEDYRILIWRTTGLF